MNRNFCKIDYSVENYLQVKKSRNLFIIFFVMFILSVILAIVGGLLQINILITLGVIFAFVLFFVSGFMWEMKATWERQFKHCPKCNSIDIEGLMNTTNHKDFKSLSQIKSFTCEDCGYEWENDRYDETK